MKNKTDVDKVTAADKIKKSLSDIKILTLPEVSEILRVHRSTVSRYAMAGELKSYVIGSRRLFRDVDVWSFFENRIASEYVSERRDYVHSTDTET